MVEMHQKHVMNVFRFHLMMGYQHWFILGFYLASYDAYSIDRIIGAINQRPRGSILMVVRYINADIADP